jgi:hypothetical protein
MAAAKAAWKAMISEKSQERKNKTAGFEELHAKAHAAGEAAAAKCTPTPMVVSEHTNPLNDNSPVKQSWYVPSGVCGFAWVNVVPGNCAFANWLKANKLGRPGYGGGVNVWVSAYGQSMELKEAYADAYAKVLNEAGVKAYSQSRMD